MWGAGRPPSYPRSGGRTAPFVSLRALIRNMSKKTVARALRALDAGTESAEIDGIRARERTSLRARRHWIRYDRSPGHAKSFVVRYTSGQAEKFAREQLEPLILRKEAVVLDFQGIESPTQSYLHALLHETLRLAWAKQSCIYVVNASPSVRKDIEFVVAYALGG